MTAIEWTDETWNPVVGCQRVSPGCERCYAEPMARRLESMGQERYLGLLTDRGRWAGHARPVPEVLDKPLRWRKARRVFVNSMSDLFHEDVPYPYIAAVFGAMASCPQHTFQILTKRPHNALNWFRWIYRRAGRQVAACVEHLDEYLERGDHPAPGIQWPLPNVWLGISAEDQQRADERIPLLLQCPAAVRFVSAEPLLGPIDLCEMRNEHGLGEGQDFIDALHGSAWTCTGPDYVDTCPIGPPLDWVIVGGESGHGARPCDVSWIRSIVRQCREAGVPCFVKQLGARYVDEANGVGGAACKPDESVCGRIRKLTDRKGGDPAEWPEDLRVRQWPESRRGDEA